MKFLLDSNFCIAALRRKAWALDALASVALEDVVVSAISVGELYHGAYRSSFPQREAARVEAFLQPLKILPLGHEEAIQWGRIEALLHAQGNAIEAEDAMIAAIAKIHALTVVTGNTRHFERVKGLKLVDWELKPPKMHRP